MQRAHLQHGYLKAEYPCRAAKVTTRQRRACTYTYTYTYIYTYTYK